ncbi:MULTISPECIES: SRPBCC family protein [unclassified Micromonospora]|uniref:SRPBCC family protein n=1 Tax=unclassified Micromonospora TaxID=2617518 RepID=UPI0036452111
MSIDPGHTLGLHPSTRHLRAALRTNAVFSTVCGLALVGAGWALTGWHLGPRWLPPLVGAALTVFAAGVARVAVQPVTPLRRQTLPVIAADVAWVAATATTLAVADLPTRTTVAAVTVAAVVGLLAGWQALGLRAVRTDDPLADLETVEAERILPAAPDRVWPLLSDHDLYGRLAPNLSSVEVISAPGQPLRRRCTNTTGNGWEETCTLYDDGHRYAVTVDTSDYPYPLTAMRGLWQVDPYPYGSRVTMRFTYQAHTTVRGGLFAIVFRPLFRPVLARIFTGWQQHLNTAPTPTP